jgi:hypothetical protein
MKNQLIMKTLVLLCALFYAGVSISQDVIILKDGDDIEAKVTEILKDNIKYKRASNPTGPTYTIAKSKVFMIRYESGDKDVFDDVYQNQSINSASEVNSTYTPPTEFLYYYDLGDPYCHVKKPFGGKVYGDRANEIFYRQDLVFYGFDFTYLKLSNPRKVGDGVFIVPKYFPAWNEMLTQDMLPIAKISSWMGKPGIFVGSSVYEYSTYADVHNFVSSVNFCMPFEDLQTVVQSYVLREKQGVGMVINLVNFNKEKEYALVYVTFFDIETREIMFAAEVTGNAGGSGMTKHWASGVEEAVRKMFIDQIYKPKRTLNHQIPYKLRLQ